MIFISELARVKGSGKAGYLVILKNKNTQAVRREPERMSYEDATKRAKELQETNPDYDILIKSYSDNLMKIPTEGETVRKRGRPSKNQVTTIQPSHINTPSGGQEPITPYDGEWRELPSNYKFTGTGLDDPDRWHWGQRFDLMGKMWPGYDIRKFIVKDLDANQSGKVVNSDGKSIDKSTVVTVKFKDGTTKDYSREHGDFKKLWISGGDRVNLENYVMCNIKNVLREKKLEPSGKAFLIKKLLEGVFQDPSKYESPFPWLPNSPEEQFAMAREWGELVPGTEWKIINLGDLSGGKTNLIMLVHDKLDEDENGDPLLYVFSGPAARTEAMTFAAENGDLPVQEEKDNIELAKTKDRDKKVLLKGDDEGKEFLGNKYDKDPIVDKKIKK